MSFWNDREDGRFVCRILDLESRRVVRTLPVPIYCVEPNGQWGLSIDFRRLNDCRPGYGYAGIPDPYFQDSAPEKTGISRVQFKDGRFPSYSSVMPKLQPWTMRAM